MTAEMTETPPLDLSSLNADDVPATEFGVPDHTRSKRSLPDQLKEAISKPRENPAPRRRKKPAPRAKKGAFVEPLTQMYTAVGVMMQPFDSQCGNVVIASAEQCAQSLDELAYQNESVRRALAALTQGSAWGAVVFAHAPIIMAVAAHHAPGIKLPTVAPVNNAEDNDGES